MKFLCHLIVYLLTFVVSAAARAACSESTISANDNQVGQLASADCSLSELIGGVDESKVDVYNLTVESSADFSFSLTSTEFDAFLRIYNNDYSLLQGEDDDSGDSFDAEISNLTLAPGSYRVLANSSTQGEDLGSYTLISMRAMPAIETFIVSSVLPSSRSVQVASTATAYSTIINGGTVTAESCGLALSSNIDASFSYQITDPATNAPVGSENMAINIGPGAAQSYIFSITPRSVIAPQEVELKYFCTNTEDAAINVGLNTLLLSASDDPVADVIALVATPVDPGIINMPDISQTAFDVFAVATANVGGESNIFVSADSGDANLDVLILLCQTNPLTAVCINPGSASTSAVEVNMGEGETGTFAIFVSGNEQLDFNPANNRIFVRFKDEQGLTRGATSVAIRTKE